MIAKDLLNMLIDQIGMEAYASNYYLAMACWCDNVGFTGTAKFFYAQSAEEREHMLKIIHFITEAGDKAIIPHIEKPPVEYNSFKNLFETALKSEKEVTAAFNKMVEKSLALKDYTTFSFLQWFVQEQLEEENQFRTILDKLKLIGEEGRSLYLLDKELGARASS